MKANTPSQAAPPAASPVAEALLDNALATCQQTDPEFSLDAYLERRGLVPEAPPATPEPPRLLSARETRERLGVSTMTLWRMERDGQLRPTRVRGKLMFDSEDIDVFIATAKRRRRKPSRRGKGGERS